jgi:hypothetical protein
LEVVGGVRVLHNVEVHFTRDDEGQILGGPAGVLRRDRKFRLFGGEEAALASLETRKLGTKLFVRIGGLLTETSDLVAESLELSIDGIGKSAITEAGELVTEILKFLAGGRGSLLLFAETVDFVTEVLNIGIDGGDRCSCCRGCSRSRGAWGGHC